MLEVVNKREEQAWRQGLWTGVVATWACIGAIAFKNRISARRAEKSRS